MSEKKAKGAKDAGEGQEKKKKKGKLPVIIALVAVLGGGGFFMMKGKGKAAEKPKIEISEELVDVPEILVNLRSENSYARMSLGLQFAKGFDTHGLDKQKPVIRDAIIGVVSSKSPSDLGQPNAKAKLKREIAAAINAAIHAAHPKDGDAGKDHAKKESGSESHGEEAAAPKHPQWDSDEGPVLKVFFSDFVTQ